MDLREQITAAPASLLAVATAQTVLDRRVITAVEAVEAVIRLAVMAAPPIMVEMRVVMARPRLQQEPEVMDTIQFQLAHILAPATQRFHGVKNEKVDCI